MRGFGANPIWSLRRILHAYHTASIGVLLDIECKGPKMDYLSRGEIQQYAFAIFHDTLIQNLYPRLCGSIILCDGNIIVLIQIRTILPIFDEIRFRLTFLV